MRESGSDSEVLLSTFKHGVVKIEFTNCDLICDSLYGYQCFYVLKTYRYPPPPKYLLKKIWKLLVVFFNGKYWCILWLQPFLCRAAWKTREMLLHLLFMEIRGLLLQKDADETHWCQCQRITAIGDNIAASNISPSLCTLVFTFNFWHCGL